jgi:hypothetical protein
MTPRLPKWQSGFLGNKILKNENGRGKAAMDGRL